MDNPWVIEWTEIALRLGLAFALGGLIGFERERTQSSAGFRTHILVCIGSALAMLLSAYGFSEFANEFNVRLDPARLAAQVIPGIGFLGAGVIMRNGVSISGLTTAASLWVVAAIGLATGAGFYFGAVLTTGIVLFSLIVLNKVERRWIPDKKLNRVKLRADASAFDSSAAVRWLESRHIEVRKIAMKHNVSGGLIADAQEHPTAAASDRNAKEVRLELVIQFKRATASKVDIAATLGAYPGVLEVSVE